MNHEWQCSEKFSIYVWQLNSNSSWFLLPIFINDILMGFYYCLKLLCPHKLGPDIHFKEYIWKFKCRLINTIICYSEILSHSLTESDCSNFSAYFVEHDMIIMQNKTGTTERFLSLTIMPIVSLWRAAEPSNCYALMATPRKMCY